MSVVLSGGNKARPFLLPCSERLAFFDVVKRSSDKTYVISEAEIREAGVGVRLQADTHALRSLKLLTPMLGNAVEQQKTQLGALFRPASNFKTPAVAVGPDRNSLVARKIRQELYVRRWRALLCESFPNAFVHRTVECFLS